MPARHGHIEVGLRSKKPAGLSMNEGLRVSMGGCAWARMRNSATTGVVVELLPAEDRLEILAAGTHADEIVLDGDPLEDVGLLAGPAAHMPLVIQAVPSSGSADTWSRAASASIVGYAVIISQTRPEKLAKITRISPTRRGWDWRLAGRSPAHRTSGFGGCPDQAGLGGMYDGGHGADQPPESLDCRGLAGDVDVGV